MHHEEAPQEPLQEALAEAVLARAAIEVVTVGADVGDEDPVEVVPNPRRRNGSQ